MKLTPAKMRAARAMLGLTQAELAALSETSESTVNAYENDKNKKAPHRSTIAAWTRILAASGLVLTDNGVEFAE